MNLGIQQGVISQQLQRYSVSKHSNQSQLQSQPKYISKTLNFGNSGGLFIHLVAPLIGCLTGLALGFLCLVKLSAKAKNTKISEEFVLALKKIIKNR